MSKFLFSFLCVSLVLARDGYFQDAAPRTPMTVEAGAGRFWDATKELGVAFRERASPTSKKDLLETGVAVFAYGHRSGL